MERPATFSEIVRHLGCDVGSSKRKRDEGCHRNACTRCITPWLARPNTCTRCITPWLARRNTCTRCITPWLAHRNTRCITPWPIITTHGAPCMADDHNTCTRCTTPWLPHRNTCHRMPSHTIACHHHIPSRGIAYHQGNHMPSLYHGMPSHTIACHHIPSQATACHRMPSHAITCHRTSLIIVCHSAE